MYSNVKLVMNFPNGMILLEAWKNRQRKKWIGCDCVIYNCIYVYNKFISTWASSIKLNENNNLSEDKLNCSQPTSGNAAIVAHSGQFAIFNRFLRMTEALHFLLILFPCEKFITNCTLSQDSSETGIKQF